jgi:hypothetical protein
MAGGTRRAAMRNRRCRILGHSRGGVAKRRRRSPSSAGDSRWTMSRTLFDSGFPAATRETRTSLAVTQPPTTDVHLHRRPRCDRRMAKRPRAFFPSDPASRTQAV